MEEGEGSWSTSVPFLQVPRRRTAEPGRMLCYSGLLAAGLAQGCSTETNSDASDLSTTAWIGRIEEPSVTSMKRTLALFLTERTQPHIVTSETCWVDRNSLRSAMVLTRVWLSCWMETEYGRCVAGYRCHRCRRKARAANMTQLRAVEERDIS